MTMFAILSAALALVLVARATGWRWPEWAAFALVGVVCTFADSML